MSTTDSKMEQHRGTEGPVRRTYASLEMTRGWWPNPESHGILPPSLNDGHKYVAVCLMDVRTYWRHVGSGKWNAPSATYEEVKP